MLAVGSASHSALPFMDEFMRSRSRDMSFWRRGLDDLVEAAGFGEFKACQAQMRFRGLLPIVREH